MQHDHERYEVEPSGFGLVDHGAKIARAVFDVGVRQMQIARRGPLRLGDLDTRVQRPHLAHPTARHVLGRHDPKLRSDGVIAGEPTRCVASAVVAAVVYQNDLEFAGIILGEQRVQRPLDDVGFVARGDHRHDRGPFCERIVGGRSRAEPLVALPEPPVEKNQIDPGRERSRAEPAERRIEGQVGSTPFERAHPIADSAADSPVSSAVPTRRDRGR